MERKKKWYVGITPQKYEAFSAMVRPTTVIVGVRGRDYQYVVGPFKTKRGAVWASRHPGFMNVDNAERRAKEDQPISPNEGVIGGLKKCRLCGLIRTMNPETLAGYCEGCRKGEKKNAR